MCHHSSDGFEVSDDADDDDDDDDDGVITVVMGMKVVMVILSFQ